MCLSLLLLVLLDAVHGDRNLCHADGAAAGGALVAP